MHVHSTDARSHTQHTPHSRTSTLKSHTHITHIHRLHTQAHKDILTGGVWCQLWSFSWLNPGWWWQEFGVRGWWHTAGVQSPMFLSSSADSQMPLGNRRLPTRGREGIGREGRAAALQLQSLRRPCQTCSGSAARCPWGQADAHPFPVLLPHQNQGASGLWIEEVTFCFSKEVLLLSASVVCLGGWGSGRVHKVGLLDLLLGDHQRETFENGH